MAGRQSTAAQIPTGSIFHTCLKEAIACQTMTFLHQEMVLKRHVLPATTNLSLELLVIRMTLAKTVGVLAQLQELVRPGTTGLQVQEAMTAIVLLKQ